MSNARFTLRNAAYALSLSKSLKKLLADHGIVWKIHHCQAAVAKMLGYSDLHELQSTAGISRASPYDHEIGPKASLERRLRHVSTLVDAGVSHAIAETVVTALSPTALRDGERLARLDPTWFLASPLLRDLTGVDLAKVGAGLLASPNLRSIAGDLHTILASDPFAGPRYARMYLSEGDGWFAGLVGDLKANADHPLLPHVTLVGLLGAMRRDMFFSAMTEGTLSVGSLSGEPRQPDDHAAFAGAMAAALAGDVEKFDAHLSAFPRDLDVLTLNIVGAALVYGLHALAVAAVAEARLGAKPGTEVLHVEPTMGDNIFPYPIDHVAWSHLAPEQWEEMQVAAFASDGDFATEGYGWRRLDLDSPSDMRLVGHCAEYGAPDVHAAGREAERLVRDFVAKEGHGLTTEVAVMSHLGSSLPFAYAAYRSGWRTVGGRLELAIELGPCGSGAMPIFADILLAGVATKLAFQAIDSSWSRVDPRVTAPIIVGPRLGVHAKESSVRDFMDALDESQEAGMQWSWPIRLGEVQREGGFDLKDEMPMEWIRPEAADKDVVARLIEIMEAASEFSGCEVSLRGLPDGTATPWIGEHEAVDFPEQDADAIIRRLYAASRRPSVLRALRGLGLKYGLACPQEATLVVGPGGSTSVMHRLAVEEVLPWASSTIPARLVDIGTGGRHWAPKAFARDHADRLARGLMTMAP